MSYSIDGRGREFMRLEVLLKGASSEICWHRAMREVNHALFDKKISEDDAQILKDDYACPKIVNTDVSHTGDEVYFYKRSDEEFCAHIDDLVVGFNGVAMNKDQPIDARIFVLKKIFDRITDLAVMEIAYAIQHTDKIEQAIRRTHHALDIMCDDENHFAPDLVKNDTLDNAMRDDKHEWHSLAVHRGENADYLRTMLTAVMQAEAVMTGPQTEPPPPHSTHSKKILVPQLARTLERRTAPSPSV